MSSTSDLIVKAALGDETRRFRIAADAVSFAELQRNLSEMFAQHVPFKTAYLDADGDLVTFSSENELRDALAQRESDAVPFKILIITATNNKTVGDDNKDAVKPTKVPNVWLDLPIWVRYRVMAFNRLVGDVNDAAVFDKLPPHAQERVHARFVAKKDKQDKKFAARMAHLHAPSIVPLAVDQPQQQDPVVELKDEELWSSMPVWLQQRVVHKFVPHLSPQASEFSSFVALPEHAKISVRNRAAKIVNKRKFERKHGAQQPPVALTNAPHPPSSPPPSETVAAAAAAAAASSGAAMSDEALWDSLPPWVQLKVAARAAHSGSVPANPRDFATFQMLPAHVQAKLRAKASRGKFHKKCW